VLRNQLGRQVEIKGVDFHSQLSSTIDHRTSDSDLGSNVAARSRL
jgi:hypothetical protein